MNTSLYIPTDTNTGLPYITSICEQQVDASGTVITNCYNEKDYNISFYIEASFCLLLVTLLIIGIKSLKRQ